MISESAWPRGQPLRLDGVTVRRGSTEILRGVDLAFESDRRYVLIGASGALEAAATAISLQHGVIPPTINQSVRDPACDLDYVPNTAREMKIEAALSNSFGFGGTNGTLAFRRFH